MGNGEWFLAVPSRSPPADRLEALPTPHAVSDSYRLIQ
jgi:hypothetical protein